MLLQMKEERYPENDNRGRERRKLTGEMMGKGRSNTCKCAHTRTDSHMYTYERKHAKTRHTQTLTYKHTLTHTRSLVRAHAHTQACTHICSHSTFRSRWHHSSRKASSHSAPSLSAHGELTVLPGLLPVYFLLSSLTASKSVFLGFCFTLE